MKIIFPLSKVTFLAYLSSLLSVLFMALVVFFINSFQYCMCEPSLRTHDEHSEGPDSTS